MADTYNFSYAITGTFEKSDASSTICTFEETITKDVNKDYGFTIEIAPSASDYEIELKGLTNCTHLMIVVDRAANVKLAANTNTAINVTSILMVCGSFTPAKLYVSNPSSTHPVNFEFKAIEEETS